MFHAYEVIKVVFVILGLMGRAFSATPDYTQISGPAEAEVVSRETPAVLIARLNLPRIVSVYVDYDERTKQPDGSFTTKVQMGCGAGIIIDSRGYIVTCGHVVIGEGNKRNYRVRFFGRDSTVPVKLVGVDELSDVAVLKVDPSRPLDPIVIGSSKGLMVGETVYAIGNPGNHTHTFSVGIIAALPRPLTIDDGGTVKIPQALQINAAVQPGSSGGVLLNCEGEMIGMAEAAHNPTISFATPVELVIEKAKKIMKVDRFQ